MLAFARRVFEDVASTFCCRQFRKMKVVYLQGYEQFREYKWRPKPAATVPIYPFVHSLKFLCPAIFLHGHYHLHWLMGASKIAWIAECFYHTPLPNESIKERGKLNEKRWLTMRSESFSCNMARCPRVYVFSVVVHSMLTKLLH